MSIPEEGIALRVEETTGITRQNYPLTRGVPLPQGAVAGVENLSLQDAQGRDVPVQVRILGCWPDESAKWVLVDFQADVEAGQEAVYTLRYSKDKTPRRASKAWKSPSGKIALKCVLDPCALALAKRHSRSLTG